MLSLERGSMLSIRFFAKMMLVRLGNWIYLMSLSTNSRLEFSESVEKYLS